MKKGANTKKVLLVLVLCFFAGIIFILSQSGGDTDPSKNSIAHIEKTPQELTYLHGDSSFRFVYKGYLKFTNFLSGEGGETTETAIFSSTEKNKGFQIFIAPYESTAPLTIETIALQNKNLDIFDPGTIDIQGEQAVVFLSAEKGSPTNTREIWFTHQGKIYQISTYADYGEAVFTMLDTWQWLQ